MRFTVAMYINKTQKYVFLKGDGGGGGPGEKGGCDGSAGGGGGGVAGCVRST